MDHVQHSTSRGEHAVIISAVFLAISGFAVMVRCFARFGLLRTCGADDVLIIFALGLSAAFTALIRAQEQHGLGRHIENLRLDEQVEILRSFWISVIVYYVDLTLIKSSILFQFLRFLIDSTIRTICWILLGIVVAFGVCTISGSIFNCLPVAYFWDKSIQGGRCINLLAFWFSNATFNILSDIAICVLPIPALKSLQLPRRQKYGLVFVFAVGGFGCVTSIIRLRSLYAVADSTDVTWDNVGAAIWSSIELNVGIICACLPTLRPLFIRLLPHSSHSRPRNIVQSMARSRSERHTHTHSWPGRDRNSSDGGVELMADAGSSHGYPLPKVYWRGSNENKHPMYAQSDQGECWSASEVLHEENVQAV